jgi:23S rRNA (uracil1939-C5)-methyltransferase
MKPNQSERVVKMEYAVNTECDVNILGLGSNGEGIGALEGKKIFVAGALPGETARVRIMESRRSYLRGTATQILVASGDRIDPICPVFGKCGGCAMMHMTYRAELEFKRRKVADALERIGGIKGAAVLPAIGYDAVCHEAAECEAAGAGTAGTEFAGYEAVGSREAGTEFAGTEAAGAPAPWLSPRCRNKAQFAFARKPGELPVIGYFKSGSHDVVDISDCHLQKPVCASAIRAVREWAAAGAAMPGGAELSLSDVIVRVGARTGEVMAMLVSRSPKFPNLHELTQMLSSSMPGLKTVVVNVNRAVRGAQKRPALGARCITATGDGYIYEELCGYRFRISPLSFFQTNTLMAERVYETALSLSELSETESALDMYCGTGSMSVCLAGRAKRVVGIEIQGEAVRDARHNANINGAGNVSFIAGSAGAAARRLRESGAKFDVVVLDPPRKGCDSDAIESVLSLAPDRIVYVSCEPATLARDLAGLLGCRAYELAPVQPFDMFPRTSGIETVSLLRRRRVGGAPLS